MPLAPLESYSTMPLFPEESGTTSSLTTGPLPPTTASPKSNSDMISFSKFGTKPPQPFGTKPPKQYKVQEFYFNRLDTTPFSFGTKPPPVLGTKPPPGYEVKWFYQKAVSSSTEFKTTSILLTKIGATTLPFGTKPPPSLGTKPPQLHKVEEFYFKGTESSALSPELTTTSLSTGADSTFSKLGTKPPKPLGTKKPSHFILNG